MIDALFRDPLGRPFWRLAALSAAGWLLYGVCCWIESREL